MRFQLVGLSTPYVPTLYLKVLLTVGGGSLEQDAWMLATQRQENFPLTINNYLLKQNDVTIYIYIYIYIWKLSHFCCI